jgi:hypothetical protein
MFALFFQCNLVPSVCGASDDCAPQATCADIAGGEYQCTCNDGYVGNGKFCLSKFINNTIDF